MVAVFTDLKRIVELAFKEVNFAPVAFNEYVFRLYDAFFGRDRFDSFAFLAEPGHRNARKGSTNRYPRLELDPLLRANACRKWMLYLSHLSHEIRGFY